MEQGEGVKVLIVEDSAILSMETEDVLTGAGFIVVGPAFSVEEVSGLLDECTIDVAVLDINLQGEAVFPVARDLLTRGIPFLFMTAYTANALLNTDFADVGVLEKPVSPDKLLRAVRQLLASNGETYTGGK
jgi:DNA-binding response OmpR family regulator